MSNYFKQFSKFLFGFPMSDKQTITVSNKELVYFEFSKMTKILQLKYKKSLKLLHC